MQVDAIKVVVASVPVLDDEGNETFTDAAPIDGVSCLFFWDDVLSSTVEGSVTLRTPFLYVLPTDPIVVGDRVLNVVDSTVHPSVLLEAATVLSIDPVANLGASAMKVAKLSGARTV